MGVPKIPAKIFIFEEILKGTFQLSAEHSIFHLEFMSVLFKPCSSYYSGFGMLPGRKNIYISAASLQELKKPGKYNISLEFITTMKQTKVL